LHSGASVDEPVRRPFHEKISSSRMTRSSAWASRSFSNGRDMTSCRTFTAETASPPSRRKGAHLDLVLMDIDLGRVWNGADAAREILKIRMSPVIFLTSHTERRWFARHRGITNYGYVLKNSGEDVLFARSRWHSGSMTSTERERLGRKYSKPFISAPTRSHQQMVDGLLCRRERRFTRSAGSRRRM